MSRPGRNRRRPPLPRTRDPSGKKSWITIAIIILVVAALVLSRVLS